AGAAGLAALRPLHQRAHDPRRGVPGGLGPRRGAGARAPARRLRRPPARAAFHGLRGGRECGRGRARDAHLEGRRAHRDRAVAARAHRHRVAAGTRLRARARRRGDGRMSAPAPAVLLEAVLAAGADTAQVRPDGTVHCRLPRWEIPACAERLGRLGLYLELLAGTDTRPESGDFTLTYVFAPAAPRALVV